MLQMQNQNFNNKQIAEENLVGTKQELIPCSSVSIQSEIILDQGKNRKWTEEEHILYIMFLELNRQKIKSKLIRRSNSFYKDMAAFLCSKTPVQCRSHHQKYEARYKYPHKIIREEKEKIDNLLYIKLLQQENNKNLSSKEFHMQAKSIIKSKQKKPKVSVTIECQTQIQGIDFPLLNQAKQTAYYMINQMPMIPQFYPQMNNMNMNNLNSTVIFW